MDSGYVYKTKKQLLLENVTAPEGGCVLIRTSSGYWGTGINIVAAKKNLISPSGDWLVNVYTTYKITIYDDGSVSAPRNSLVARYSTVPVKG